MMVMSQEVKAAQRSSKISNLEFAHTLLKAFLIFRCRQILRRSNSSNNFNFRSKLQLSELFS